ncbi:MAG TPA: hypothetical protein VKD91_16190 [Pyrinomonadaceae bacterium]|nr:hypothetical protein [Pyrinomonadaceae bacterium]
MKPAYLSPLIACVLLGAEQALPQQPSAQNPSPMVDHTRPHPRIPQTEVTGRRVELKSLKGARLFIGPRFNSNKAAPLVIHFHGAPWLVEQHIARHLPGAALITVQLGAGSGAYRSPFERSELFRLLIDEASMELKAKQAWSSITLMGFSAGYGAVREILRRPEYFALVNNVLLLDGMHTSYVPEGKPLADGGTLEPSGLDVFVKFAREAVAGGKCFVFTHSEIFPGTYASTTECADYLLAQLNLQRHPELHQGPMGMQQLSAVNATRFHLRGYAGNSAPDHVDHLHAMPAWFSLLRFH